MLRSDALWRNGGRLLSVALLGGGLAFNASGIPIEMMDVQGHNTPSQTWLTLEHGWLCRTWSNTLTASTASIPPIVMSPTAKVVPLAFSTKSLQSVKAEFMGGARSFDTIALGQGQPYGVTHCTTQWHVGADGRLISDAPSWAPNPNGDWPAASENLLAMPLRASSRKLALAGTPSVTTPKIESVHVIRKKVTTFTAHPTVSTSYTPVSPGGIGPWTPVPGHPSYGMSDFAGDPHSSEFGVCTWWAWYMRRDEPQLGYLGYASNWINAARAKGMRTGYAPAVGATVVFQPGVQGASGSGHVGHVVQLLSGGWFIISEMNFYWNGGGWGRVDYRYVHTGSGVAFIY